MTADDIVSALEGLRALVRDPVTGTYALRLDYKYFQEYIEKWEAKKYLWLNPECLLWTPYVMGRSNLAHLEHAPPLATIAPREGEEANDMTGPKAEGDVQMHDQGEDEEHLRKPPINGLNPEQEGSKSPGPPKSMPTPSTDTDKFAAAPAQHSAAVTNPVPGPPPKTPLAKAPNLPTRTASGGIGGIPSANSKPANIPCIPPTRFEIYPPLPGTAGRRKVGRPPASSRRRTATPASLSRRDTEPGSRRGNGGNEVNLSGGRGGGASNTVGKGKTASKRNTRGKSAGKADPGQADSKQVNSAPEEFQASADVKSDYIEQAIASAVAPAPNGIDVEMPDQSSEAQLTKEMEQASMAADRNADAIIKLPMSSTQIIENGHILATQKNGHETVEEVVPVDVDRDMQMS